MNRFTDRVAATKGAEHPFQRLIENARDLVYRTRVLPTRAIEYIGGAVERDTIPLSDAAGEVAATGVGVWIRAAGDR